MNDDKNTLPPSSRSLQFKFGLRQLFYATALIASGLAMSASTISISVAVLLGWWGVFFSSLQKRLGWGLVIILLIYSVCLPPWRTTRGPHRSTMCMLDLKQIAVATLNYESVYGRLPTDRMVTLDDGTELRHSWRIEILAFLEGQTLTYSQYNFHEPWNGPNNSKLELRMPECFTCSYRNDETKTPYKLVNGPGTAFEIEKNISFTDLPDGTFNTIGLIEDQANPTHWMEPGDFTAEEAARALNSITKETAVQKYETFFTKFYVGSCIAKVDGSTHRWPPIRDTSMQPGAFLIDDGYLFDSDVQGQAFTETKYGVCFALGIYLLLIVLPVFFLSGSPPNSIATLEIE